MNELRPYPDYLFVSGAYCFMLCATNASVYRIQTVGLNPPQLVLVGTVLELAVLILPLLFGGVRLVRGRPVLWMLLVIAAFSGMSSEGFNRLWEAGHPEHRGRARLCTRRQLRVRTRNLLVS